MKMIYVGELKTAPDRDSFWLREFQCIGWKVIPFSTKYQPPSHLLEKFCRRLNIGPANNEIQQALLVLIQKEKPAWIHFRLPIQFDRQTIMEITTGDILGIVFDRTEIHLDKSR